MTNDMALEIWIFATPKECSRPPEHELTHLKYDPYNILGAWHSPAGKVEMQKNLSMVFKDAMRKP